MDIIDRYKRQVSIAKSYATDELRGAPTSTFEIMVGHFAQFVPAFEAEIATLRAQDNET